MSLDPRFLDVLNDPRLDSVRLQRLDNPGRGEGTAFQVILNPKADHGRPIISILRVPQPALTRALDQWFETFPPEAEEADDLDDLLA